MEQSEKCTRCGCIAGLGIIKVLGCGGDYEDWPCPQCQPEAYARAIWQTYGHGGYDSSNAD